MGYVCEKKPEVGDIRIRRKFLLFPKSLPLPNGLWVWKWLVIANIEQEYSIWRDWPPGFPEPVNVVGWRNKKWIERER